MDSSGKIANRLSSDIKKHLEDFSKKARARIPRNRLDVVEKLDSIEESPCSNKFPTYTQSEVEEIIDFVIDAVLKEIKKQKLPEALDKYSGYVEIGNITTTIGPPLPPENTTKTII